MRLQSQISDVALCLNDEYGDKTTKHKWIRAMKIWEKLQRIQSYEILSV
jgi:hypothetical protein